MNAASETSTRPASTRSRALAPVSVALALALTVGAFYAHASWDNGFIYDDVTHVVDQAPFNTLREVFHRAWNSAPRDLPYFRPLTYATLYAQKRIHGDRPRPFHMFNAALAGALFLAAVGLFRHPAFKLDRFSAFAAALLFVLHPVFASCVYPVTGRETLLPALFILLGVRLYLDGRRLPFGLALAAFALGLLAKEQAAVVPLLCLATELLPRENRRIPSTTTRVLRFILLFALLAAYFAFRHARFGGADAQLALPAHPTGPVQSLVYSLQTALLPDVRLAYEPPPAVWFSWPRFAAAALLLAALAAALTWRTDAARRRVAGFWLAWFLIAQSMTANILVQETRFSERYLLVSLLALPALAGLVSSRPGLRRFGRTALRAGLCLWIAVLGAVTYARAGAFRNPRVFFEQWLATNPQAPAACLGLGNVYAADGYPARALTLFDRALELRPDDAEALNNRGRALDALGRPDEAAASYRRALAVNPSLVSAHNNLARHFAERGELQQALRHTHAAVEAMPGAAASHQNHAGVLYALGRREEAIAHYRRALDIDPDLLEAHFNLGNALRETGHPQAARAHLQRALALARERDLTELEKAVEARLRTP